MNCGKIITGKRSNKWDVTFFIVVFEVCDRHSGLAIDEENDAEGHGIVALSSNGVLYFADDPGECWSLIISRTSIACRGPSPYNLLYAVSFPDP